jgi:hypothetical protein
MTSLRIAPSVAFLPSFDYVQSTAAAEFMINIGQGAKGWLLSPLFFQSIYDSRATTPRHINWFMNMSRSENGAVQNLTP